MWPRTPATVEVGSAPYVYGQDLSPLALKGRGAEQELINKAVAILGEVCLGGQSALGAVTRWRQLRHSGRKWQLAGALEIALKALFRLKLYLKLDYL